MGEPIEIIDFYDPTFMPSAAQVAQMDQRAAQCRQAVDRLIERVRAARADGELNPHMPAALAVSRFLAEEIAEMASRAGDQRSALIGSASVMLATAVCRLAGLENS